MEAQIYNTKGTAAGNITLPEAVFGAKWNANLVHDVVMSMMGNMRSGSAHTKTRAEVRGGGRKPWKQKGTGRARHGSRRSPIWRGGGVTFGPRNLKDYSRKINKKMRAKALAVVLSKKFTDGEVGFVDAISFDAPKASQAKVVLGTLGGVFAGARLSAKRKNSTLIVLAGRNENTEKSFQNFGNVLVTQVKDLNPVELLTYKHIVIAQPTEAVAILTQRVSGSTSDASAVAAEVPKKRATAKPKKVAKKPARAKKAAVAKKK